VSDDAARSREAVAKLVALANEIAAKVERSTDDDTRQLAVHTLRMLASSLESLSVTCDELRASYEMAFRLAQEAQALAGSVLPGRRKTPS
jgi:hypothetical protein